ncbi:MAG: hypothetical protein IT478_06185 [Xanthomonadales bacterium]|nr:hypothetical protein [Xanthomonadales bacterium]
MKALRFLLHILGAAIASGAALAGPGYWTSNGPFGGVIYEVRFDPASAFTIYASTRGGLFRTLDGGASWTRIENGIANSAIGMPFTLDPDAPGTLYAFDQIGILYRSSDSGDNWAPTGYSVPTNLIPSRIEDVPGVSGQVMIALSSYDQETFPSADVMVRRSTDSGATFVAVAGIPNGRGFARIAFDPANPSIVLAGTDYLYPTPAPAVSPDVLFRSSDGGLNFAPAFAPGVNPGYIPAVQTIAFGAGSRVYVGSSDYAVGVLRSDSDGSSWNTATGNASRLLANPSVADEVYASGTGVQVSIDGGLTWTPRNTGLSPNPSYLDPGTAAPLPAYVNGLAASPGFPAPGSSLWVASDGGGLFRSLDLGANWSSSGINEGLAAVNVRAVLVHTNPATIGGGGTGQRMYAGFSDAFYSTSGIFGSSSGGSNWTTANNGLEAATIRAMAIDPLRAGTSAVQVASSYLYASGRSSLATWRARNGSIYRSITGGLSWAKIDGDLPRRGTPPNDYIQLGTVRDIRLDPRSCTIPLAPVACTSGTLKRMVATTNGNQSAAIGGVVTFTHRIIRSDNVDTTAIHPLRGTLDVTWTDISGDLTPSTNTLGVLGQLLTPVNVLISPSDPEVMYVGTYKGFTDYDPSDAITFADIHTGVFKTINGGVNWLPVNTGLPRIAGFTNSVYDVLALEMHPTNHDVLWATVIDFDTPNSASIYKTTNGGVSWFESAAGIAAHIDIRDLMVDPGDPNILYAAGAGTPSNPGSVYKSDDGGANWHSISVGLPADSALALTLDPFVPALLHAGTNTGVWSLTQLPDADVDGISDATENNAPGGGDGNGDGLPDAAQRDVGSTVIIFRGPAGTGGFFTSDVITELSTPTTAQGCKQAVDVQAVYAVQHGRDYLPGGRYYKYPRDLVRFEVLDCSRAVVDVAFHNAAFNTEYGWSFRFRGPATPGADGSIGWHDISARAARVAGSPTKWRLTLDANQFGSYRPVGDNVMFVGGPACYDDRIFRNNMETDPDTGPPSCDH